MREQLRLDCNVTCAEVKKAKEQLEVIKGELLKLPSKNLVGGLEGQRIGDIKLIELLGILR